MLLYTGTLLGQQVEIYVSNGIGSASSIKKFDGSGNYVEDFITMSNGVCTIDWTQDIVLNPVDNTLLISSLNTNEILKYNAVDGACVGVFATVTGGPTRMKIGADNLLYVLQWTGNGKVLRYQLDGTFVDEFTAVGVANSIGLDWDIQGNLYVSSYNGSSIRKFDSSGNDLGLFLSANLQGPTNIWFDSAGNLFVLNWDGNLIKKFDSAGNFLTNIGGAITNPEGVAFLPNGNFLIGNGATNGKITEYASDGSLVGVFASGNGLSYPNGIYVKELSASTIEMNQNQVFVWPTIGNIFSINQSIIESGGEIEVLDMLGRKMDVIHLCNANKWNADHLNNGMYLLSGERNGKKLEQRIIVDHF